MLEPVGSSTDTSDSSVSVSFKKLVDKGFIFVVNAVSVPSIYSTTKLPRQRSTSQSPTTKVGARGVAYREKSIPGNNSYNRGGAYVTESHCRQSKHRKGALLEEAVLSPLSSVDRAYHALTNHTQSQSVTIWLGAIETFIEVDTVHTCEDTVLDQYPLQRSLP